MPTFHLKANQADIDIQELKNQNSFLHGEVKALKSELAIRPTLAVLKQEINKYSSGDRLTSSASPSGGLQGLPKLDKLEPKNFRAFCTQFKHFALLSNWTHNQEALHLPLALSQSISGKMMRCIPQYREMTSDEILRLGTNESVPRQFETLLCRSYRSCSSSIRKKTGCI